MFLLRIAGCFLSILLAVSIFARADDAAVGLSRSERSLIRALEICRKTSSEDERLSCYDALAKKNAPPDYSGKHSFKTPTFILSRPHRLRYQSEGVIFVLYLLDDKGNVLQNLHIGGGGEDSFVIKNPGTYALHINGSKTWRIWIEPVHETNIETTTE